MPETEDTYSEKETEARREAALKQMLATPPKTQEEARKPRRPKRA